MARQIRHQEDVSTLARREKNVDPLQRCVQGTHDHGPDPVGLKKLDSRDHPGPAEGVGPGARVLTNGALRSGRRRSLRRQNGGKRRTVPQCLGTLRPTPLMLPS